MSEDIFSKTEDFSEEEALLNAGEVKQPEAVPQPAEQAPFDQTLQEPNTSEEMVGTPQEFHPEDKNAPVKSEPAEPAPEENQPPAESVDANVKPPFVPLADAINPDNIKKLVQEDDYKEEAAMLDHEEPQRAFFGDSTWATIKDVGLALYKAPAQAAIETGEAITWIGQQAAKLDPITTALDGFFGFGEARKQLQERGNQAFDQLSQRLDQAIPTTTGAGEMVGTAAQFAAGFIGGGQFTKGIKAIQRSPEIINTMTRGALADFLAFDEQQKNMSAMIQEHPTLQNPVTEFLANKDPQNKLEGRLKNALEGVLVTGVSESVLTGLKVLKGLAPEGWLPNGKPATAVDRAIEMTANMTKQAKDNYLKDVQGLVDKSKWDVTRDTLIHLRTSNLLGLTAHVTNTVSNTGVALNSLGERAIARGFTKAIGGPGVEAGEIGAQVNGMMRGAIEGIQLAKQAFKTGESVFSGSTKLEVTPDFGAAKFGLTTDNLLGKGVEMLGKITNLTGKGLQAEDEFFKTVSGMGEQYALVQRKLVREGLTGDEFDKAFSKYIKRPPIDIYNDSLQAAKVNTFTDDLGGLAKRIEGIRNEYPVTKTIVPFFKTLAKVAQYGLERFPPTTFAFTKNREAWAAGGADKALVAGKIGMGSLYMMVAGGLYQAGILTGKGDWKNAAEGASGFQPYSIKVGDTYTDISKYQPVGQIMRLAADTFETLAHLTHPDDEETAGQLILNTISTFGEALMQGTWAENLTDTFSALTSGGPSLQKFIQGQALSVIDPAVLQAATKVVDPHVREAQSFLDQVKKGIPGLSDTLPKRYDIYGREETYAGNGIPGFFGVKTKTGKPDKFDDALAGLNIPLPKYTQYFQGVPMNLREHPEIFSEMMKQSAEVKNPEYGMKTLHDTLDDLVDGKGFRGRKFNKLSDDGKAAYVRDVLNSYRAIARQKIYTENDEFRMAVKAEREANQLKKTVHDRILGPTQ